MTNTRAACMENIESRVNDELNFDVVFDGTHFREDEHTYLCEVTMDHTKFDIFPDFLIEAIVEELHAERAERTVD